MTLKTECVLFDLDGTLVDSAPDLGYAANLVREALGMAHLPLADYRPQASNGARGLLKVALGGLELAWHLHDQLGGDWPWLAWGIAPATGLAFITRFPRSWPDRGAGAHSLH